MKSVTQADPGGMKYRLVIERDDSDGDKHRIERELTGADMASLRERGTLENVETLRNMAHTATPLPTAEESRAAFLRSIGVEA